MGSTQTQPPCPCRRLFSLLLLLLLLCSYFLMVSSASSSPSSLLRGVHPLNLNYFNSEVIKCKDGSNSFTKNRLNDDFCDCLDATDEPGTSACPGGKFYCRNLGSQPRFMFSSRVNDHICDCCDGSDEFDGVVYCPNTCIMGGSIEYKTELHQITNIIQEKESKPNGRLDIIQNLKDLKVLALLQLIIVLFGALYVSSTVVLNLEDVEITCDYALVFYGCDQREPGSFQ